MSLARVQAAFRGRRCRRLLTRARALPCDMWEHVLLFLRDQDVEGLRRRAVRRFLELRVLRMRFGPPRVAQREFPRVARLVRTHAALLSPRTLAHARACALRILVARPAGRPRAAQRQRPAGGARPAARGGPCAVGGATR